MSFWAWVVALPLALGGQPVLANERQEVRATVAYADLDLSRPAGIAKLERRVAAAVLRVCGPRSIRPLDEMAEQRRCAAEAKAGVGPQISRAVAQAQGDVVPSTYATLTR